MSAPRIHHAHTLCLPWQPGLETTLPVEMALHEATVDWMEAHNSDTGGHPRFLHLYTDGSALPAVHTAAWAFSAFDSQHMDDDVGSFRFLGWLGGGVELDPESPLFLGALTPDSTNAEASALFWATLYLFTVKENYVAVEFCFDALNVGRAMDAHFNAPEHHPLVGNLRMLTQGAEATMGPANLKMTHIRAHQGHPLNEMVNTLARWCTSSPMPQLPPLDLQWLFAENCLALRWLWLGFRSDREPECIPPLVGEALHIAPPTMQRAPEPELPWTFDYAWSDNEGKTFVPCCSFMTYNVRTLKDPSTPGQDYAPGRLQYLEAQLADQNVHVVGLQETRCSRDSAHPSSCYHKFRVAAEHGQGGIELWVLRSSPLGLGCDGPVYPNLSEAVVIHAHHELLLVRIRLVGPHSWLIVVGHAPHKGHSEQTKAMWWDSLDQLLRQHLGSSQPIILVDANASLGIPDGPGLGTLHATEEDYNGSRLRLLLEYYDMWLPCTFDGVHQGLYATWFSSASASPQGLRNDYIGLPTSWTSWTCSSMTCPDIDVAQHGLDHVAAMVCIKGTTSSRPTCRRSTQPRIDWRKMRACKDADTWDRIFDGLPQPSWDTDVHTHWQSCHSALMQRFARFFPKPRSCPRKPYITAEVWQLRTQKQALRRQLAIRAHMCPAVPLVAAFQTLKYQQPFRRTFLSGLLWLLRCNAAHLQDRAHLRRLQDDLAKALKAQRIQYLENVADEANHAPRSEIYARLRKAGFCSTRKRRTRPLPALQTPDGLPVDNLQALRAVFRPSPQADDGPTFWNDLILQRPGCWTGLLRKSEAHALLQLRSQDGVARFHKEILEDITSHFPNIHIPVSDDPPEAEPGLAPYPCLPCQVLFSSKTAWAVHAFRKHGRRSSARYLAEGNTCDACHHVFLNEHRLYLHLRYSHSCFEQLRHRGLQAEPTPGRGSRHWNQQEQFTLCPYGLAFGPDLPPRPTDLPALAPHETDLLMDLTSLEHLDFPEEDEINQLWLRIKDVLCRHSAAFEDMERALQCWRAFLAEEQPTHRRLRPWRFACFLHAIDLALIRLDLDHLAPDLLPRQGPGAHLDDPQDRLKALCPAVFPSPGYGPKTTQAVFVHLYSGRRRQGDLQCAIEALQLDDAWPPIVISLDIVLNEEFGNILRPEARSFWLAQAARGALDGLMLGPPCETWTISRERWFLDFSGPRPIRDNVCPWGLSSLLIGEANQIFSSNSLMTFGLTMWWRMWRTGNFAALEHPGEPDPRDHPCAATIWRTPIGLFLRGLPQASLELVLQGYHGAISPKPTGLLLANSPGDFASTERRMRSVDRLPPPLRMGQERGRWRTAQLKEYPEGFNRLIAELFRMWWMRTPSHTSPFLPSPSEAQIYSLFASHVGQGEMGPDHAVGAARNYGIHPD
eukprot:Skav236529  [mRNA]  locus=scaffold78:1073914:1079907:- [translate_table: standard]